MRDWEANGWYDVWVSDRESMLETMIRNLRADLDAGYDYFGASATAQRAAIDEFKREFDAALESFKTKTTAEILRWCYFDLKKHGAIA